MSTTRFGEHLAAGSFAVALEITPPQRSLPKVLLRRAAFLGELPTAINVIQRPGRQSSLEASCALKEAGLEPVWHLVTRGREASSVAAELAVAREANVTQVLCILGDHSAEPAAKPLSVRDAVKMVASELPGALTGATLNQYGEDQAAALRNLIPKLQAGASYIQTQPVFEPDALEPFVERIRSDAPTAHLVGMVMPLLSADAATKMEARLRIALPEALKRAIAESEESAWAAFEANVARIARSGLFAGVAVMTFEMDPAPEVALRVTAALQAARAGRL